MDDFLNFLIKKSDIKKNEYYNYRQKNNTTAKSTVSYEKINEPILTSYVVFDFETTGLSPFNDKIIEIGAIKVIDNEIVGSFNMLVNPERTIPPFIEQKIHITNKMVQNKETIHKVLPLFIDFIEQLPLIAHNARFDMSFLINNANILGYNIKNPALDTCGLSRKYNKECKSHSLGNLCNYFGIELNNAHRAYFDVMATNELYKILQHKHNKKTMHR